MAEGKSVESNANDWRQLCAAAAKEQDGTKLTSLVNQIIKALDESNPRFRRTATIDRCPEF